MCKKILCLSNIQIQAWFQEILPSIKKPFSKSKIAISERLTLIKKNQYKEINKLLKIKQICIIKYKYKIFLIVIFVLFTLREMHPP